MPPAAIRACGHRVTATLKAKAAVVPSETSVFMLALPCRRAATAPRWKLPPTQTWMGSVRANWTQGSPSIAGAHGKICGKLPITTGTARAPPASVLTRSRPISRARAASSRSGSAAAPASAPAPSGMSYPAARTARRRSATATRPAGRSTSARSAAKFTDAPATPATPRRAASTRPAQAAQLIPVTGIARRVSGTSYPSSAIRPISRSTSSAAGSKLTDARSAAKLTVAPATPGSAASPCSIRAAQAAQLIPRSGRSTVVRLPVVIGGSAAIELREDPQQLGDLAVAVPAASRPDRVHHAPLDMPAHEGAAHLVERGPGGRHLVEDVHAVRLRLHHPLEPSDLPLDPPEAAPQRRLRIEIQRAEMP